jgi:fibronectin type 3 domain-containing protein
MKNITNKVVLLFTLFVAILIGPKINAASVGLAWDANTEPDLAGYKVYYGTASRNYTNTVTLGLVTTYTVTNVFYDITTYFAVTAFNSAGLESEFSNEVSATVATPQPPAVPVSLAAANRGRGKAGVTFPYADTSVGSFKVSTNGVLMLTVPRGTASPVVIDLPSLVPGVLYAVQVSAVGTNSLESAQSAALNLRIPASVNVRRN